MTQPITDDKVLTSWNGMMIAALADAGRVLNEPAYTTAAQRAADAIVSHMATADGGLYRTMRNGEAKIPGSSKTTPGLSTACLRLEPRPARSTQVA
ncbi:MAG: hypothetical protein R3C45_00490 [Phycisphaerales bacterium]